MWEAIVIIVVVTSFAKVIRARIVADRWTGGRAAPFVQVNSPDENRSDNREAESLRREISTLTERIQVLERITTDAHRGESLAAEIEALRGVEKNGTSSPKTSLQSDR